MRATAWIGVACLCAAVTGVLSQAQAQDLVWRCGSTLTNRLPDDEAQRGACVPVSLPRVTTLPAPDRKSTRLNSSHSQQSRMPSSA